MPTSWYFDDIGNLVGKPWRELEVFKLMPRWPSDMDGKKRYVVFYSRTCDHCEEMFLYDLTDPALGSIVTAIQMPDTADTLMPDNAWEMPYTGCERLVGSDGAESSLRIAGGGPAAAERRFSRTFFLRDLRPMADRYRLKGACARIRALSWPAVATGGSNGRRRPRPRPAARTQPLGAAPR